MKDNLLTKSSEGVLKIIKSADKQMKGMAGDMPFNYRKATPEEMKARRASLTPERLQALVLKYGHKEVNEFLKNTEG